MAGKIFLSYRREDTGWLAHALFARLEMAFPSGSLFMDVAGGIGAGQDFVRVLEEQVGACDAMLVLIGPDWLTVTDESGRRRLDNPHDFVHVEIESALQLGKHVIPVLVQKIKMPSADALPEPLKPLVRRNAVGLSQEGFQAEVQTLIEALSKVVEYADTTRAPIDPRLIRTFSGHTDSVTSVVFSPDGRSALSGSWDKTLKLWDVATGKETRTFSGHTGGVRSVAFSPDGRSALSGSADKTLKLWDLTAGR